MRFYHTVFWHALDTKKLTVLISRCFFGNAKYEDRRVVIFDLSKAKKLVPIGSETSCAIYNACYGAKLLKFADAFEAPTL